MGFFSRLFQPRADGLAAPEDWTSLPASEASALVLYDEEASRLLAAFDIEADIVMHERWLPWLAQALAGARDEQLRPETVVDDTCSELGRWLHGSGRVALGHFPAFDMLMRRHQYFHHQAAVLLTHLAKGDQLRAEQAFKSCQHASRQVVLLLKELQRGLGHGKRPPQPMAAGER